MEPTPQLVLPTLISLGIWFRFSSYSGDTIVDRATNNSVPTQYCGTLTQIYIQGLGSHPVTDNTARNTTVCANYGGSDTCYWNDTIQIYRCPAQGDPNYFYLYKLKSPPVFSSSYCVGEKNVCNRGDLWNGFSCVSYFPAMKACPIFSGPHINGSVLSAEIYFSCEVQYDRQSHDSNARFRVTFLFDGQPLEYIDVDAKHPSDRLEPTILNPSRTLVAILDESKLRGRLGTKISCQAESMWDGYSDSESNMRSVATYYTAFEVATKAGDSFALVFEKYNNDEVTARGKSLWRDYVIPPVSITILPQLTTPYKTCTAFIGPYFVTFDDSIFDNLELGDFYMARAINVNQLMEIQIRHEICNYGKATCICGVIVREGNSAFKISICEAGSWSAYSQRSPSVVRLLSQDPADSSTVYVDGTGLKFSIRMPSGLRVEVDLTISFSNVEVHLPPEYHGKTDSASMCGNSNDYTADDSTNLQQFRIIPDNLSYFRRHPPCSSSIYNVAATRCGGNTTYPICSKKDPALESLSRSYEPFSGRSTTGVVCDRTNQKRRRDSMETSLSENSNSDNDFVMGSSGLFLPDTYDPKFGANVSFTWPTPSGKTKQEVEQPCADMLQSSPAYDACSASVDIATIIAMCASEIQIADDRVSVSAYANAFQLSCLNNLAADIKNNSDPTIGALMTVSEKHCPNQCRDHGTCSDATCTCNTGYIGADCSIDQTQPPSLTGIIRGGACDVRVRPCDVINVYGSGVAFSSPLKCRFTDPSTSVDVETDGTFITAVEYSCPVPETTTHRRGRSSTTRTTVRSAIKVSITVDGVLYSNELDFVLFDSVCMECNSSDTCRQTDNSCLFIGECFAKAAVNPDDPCLQCVPSVNRNLWTNRTVVEEWSPCRPAGDCKTGVTTRSTVCGSTVIHEEVKSCKVLDCPKGYAGKVSLFSIYSFEGILTSSLSYFLLTLALATFCMSLVVHHW